MHSLQALEHVETKHGRHYRVSDGRLFVGVTTVLEVLGKPFLIPWAAKLERQHVLDAAQTIYEQLPAERVHVSDFVRWVKDKIGRAYRHKTYTDEAAAWGTQLHAYMEYRNKLEMGMPVGPEPALPPGGEIARDQYFLWRVENQMQMLGAEVRLVSHEHQYAGTMDWWGNVQSYGRLTVGDWKSSKSIYPEMFMQNSAYIHAMIEMGMADPPIDGVIVKMPKDPNWPYIETKHLPWEVQGELFQGFLAALELWRWQKKWGG